MLISGVGTRPAIVYDQVSSLCMFCFVYYHHYENEWH